MDFAFSRERRVRAIPEKSLSWIGFGKQMCFGDEGEISGWGMWNNGAGCWLHSKRVAFASSRPSSTRAAGRHVAARNHGARLPATGTKNAKRSDNRHGAAEQLVALCCLARPKVHVKLMRPPDSSFVPIGRASFIVKYVSCFNRSTAVTC